MQADAAVIGGGVVGLATAMRLAEAGMRVILLERHENFGREASSRNSEVVHAGIYYPPHFQKVGLCVDGNRATYAWCESHRVPHRRLGKFVVATSEGERDYLVGLLARSHQNGVAGTRWAEPGELAAAEPDVRALAALWVPSSGIVDSHSLMASFAAAAEESGAVLAFGHEYLGVELHDAGYTVRYRSPGGAEESLTVARVVNASGLSADIVAESAGLDVDAIGYRLCHVRGVYFRLADRWTGRFSHLIYPVPHEGLSGLGVHVTLDMAGGVRLGPDVERLDHRRQEYTVDPGRAVQFASAAGRYLPHVSLADLRPDQAGIRARRIVPEGGAPDFIIVEESERGLPNWVNLIGIESPGLTAALPIADRVVALLS